MDSEVSFMLARADNELLAANSLNKISEEEEVKTLLDIPMSTTFYSSVISHAYYAIFYSAKAYLIFKKIKIPKQGQHQAVHYEFKKLVKQGAIDKELLKIYEEAKIKADELLEVLQDEKDKRAAFTYETLPQANKEPAEESLKNAVFFISHIKKFIV